MDIGITMFATDYSIRIDELAREAEARGFESLFVPEHTHIPASRRSPWPGGAELPRDYWHTLDPFVGLAAAAAVTTRLRLGTGIALLTERDPILTAKESATLDLLSDGRFELGIGAGWNAEEMENHGTVFADRFRVMMDRALAIKAIWSADEPEYHGDFVDFEPIWSWPKPVQRPHPPILLGGESRHSLRRIVRHLDGWMPRARGGFDAPAEMARLRRFAEEAERDPATVNVSVFAPPPDAQTMESYREAGVDRAILAMPSEGRDEALARLDRLSALLG